MPDNSLPLTAAAAPSENPQKNPHEKGVQTFARVFANDLALREINKEKPVFAAGSIIVREKLARADTTAAPELVTVMIKRERGFSRETDDWEFLVVNGAIEKVTQRETVGSCAKCHVQARESDWVFRDSLK